MKQNRNGTFDELMSAIKAVLEHHFNNHEFCGNWCPVKRGNTNGKYRSKEVHGKLYVHLQKTMEYYANEEKMRQLFHSHSTQGNEAMNQSVASYAPKTKTYSPKALPSKSLVLSTKKICVTSHHSYATIIVTRCSQPSVRSLQTHWT